MRFLRRLFGKKEVAATPPLSPEEVMEGVVAEYLRRMVDAITSLETRSRNSGKFAEMMALRSEILATLTDGVVTSLAEDFNLSYFDISVYIATREVSPEEDDPFAKFRGPNHLLEGIEKTLFTFYWLRR